jgi:4a-hydroxytetrahydrobiopterin dehydratase
MVALAQRPCNPCRGGVEPLTREQCAPYLTEVPDWELSALAEETWHHPELTLGWGFCEVSLTTRKIGGLHESDFVMAARIDALALSPLDSAWLPPLPPPRRATR